MNAFAMLLVAGAFGAMGLALRAARPCLADRGAIPKLAAVCIIVAILAFAHALAFAEVDDTEDDPAKLRAEIVRLRRENASLRAELDITKRKADRLALALERCRHERRGAAREPEPEPRATDRPVIRVPHHLPVTALAKLYRTPDSGEAFEAAFVGRTVQGRFRKGTTFDNRRDIKVLADVTTGDTDDGAVIIRAVIVGASLRLADESRGTWLAIKGKVQRVDFELFPEAREMNVAGEKANIVGVLTLYLGNWQAKAE